MSSNNNGLYVLQTATVKINLNPDEMNDQYEESIKKKIKHKYGDICYGSGFIKKSSIEIVKIENGKRKGSHLHGTLTFKVEFSALYCVPRRDKMIRAKIQTVNKFGILSIAYPMTIIVPRQLQKYENIDVLASVTEGDYVYVRSKDYTVRENRLVVVGIITEKALDVPNFLELPSDGLISDQYHIELSVGSVPPLTFAALGDNESLNLLKNKITPYVNLWESKIKYLINPYEQIDIYRPSNSKKNVSIISYDVEEKTGLYPIFSRAYFKLWEIISELDVLKGLQYQDQAIRIANLAEGPGGFIQCLIDYRNQQHHQVWKKDCYHAITLRADQAKVMDWNSAKSEQYFSKRIKEGYNIHLSYGKSDGNLLDINNIRQFTQDYTGQCHLITADGGIELETDEEYAIQELANAKLFFAEIITALTMQKLDGSFILKIYDIYYQLTLQMIQILSCYYDQIVIVKPRTSRPANSEKYLVCKRFNGIAPEQLTQLYDVLVRWVETESKASYLENQQYVNGVMIAINNHNSCFQQNIAEFNEYNLTLQIEKITEGLNLVATSGMDQKNIKDTYQEVQKDLAIKWCQRFQIPFINQLTETKLNQGE